MRFNGLKEALEVLRGLSLSEQKRILADIAQQDAQLASQLDQALIKLDDLVALTPKMMGELMQEISTDDMGMALRGAAPATVEKLLSMVSSRIADDIREILQGAPKPLSEVEKAQQKIIDLVRDKIERGEIVLDLEGSEKYV